MNALEQRLSALESANRVRMVGAQIKKELKSLDAVAGHRRAADLVNDWGLLDPPPALSVHNLLLPIKQVGVSRAGGLCRQANINPARRVSDFTADQRLRLVRLLETKADRIEREQSQRAKGRRDGS